MHYKRHSELLSEEIIRKVYKANDLDLTPKLLHFEKNYAGLLIRKGGYPIEFKTIWRGGFPFNPKLATIEYEHFIQDDSNLLIQCTEFNTNPPTHYALDEKGRFYENYILVYNSFEEMLKTSK